MRAEQMAKLHYSKFSEIKVIDVLNLKITFLLGYWNSFKSNFTRDGTLTVNFKAYQFGATCD